jgi:hypothetical protein
MALVITVISAISIGGFAILAGRYAATSMIVPFKDYTIYKYKKAKLYKSIDKAIEELDYESFKKYITLLKQLKYEKYEKLLKLKGLNDDIIYNEKYFKIHFDPKKAISIYKDNEDKINYNNLNDRLAKLERSMTYSYCDFD